MLADGGVRVVDNGRGIPVDIVAVEGKPAVEVVLTVLHAGGKFGGGGYQVSGGLHGVGVSVVNALSTPARGRGAARRPRLDRQSYQRGAPTAPLLERRGDRARPAPTITFWADDEIFETTHYDFEILARTVPGDGVPQPGPDDRPRPTSASDSRARTTAARAWSRYHYDGGIADFVRHLNAARARGAPEHHRTSRPRTPRRGCRLEVAMQWNSGFAESVHTFANTINTHEGGTHEEGFRAALTTTVNKFAREWGVLKEKDTNLSGDDSARG